MMPGAPNCQNPVWSPEELAIIARAWDVAGAVVGWEAYLSTENYRTGIIPRRSYKAIASEWYRQHPLLHSCPNTPLDRELGIALDELERAL